MASTGSRAVLATTKPLIPVLSVFASGSPASLSRKASSWHIWRSFPRIVEASRLKSDSNCLQLRLNGVAAKLISVYPVSLALF